MFSISPIDGRYAERTKDLQQFFSELGLIKYRTKVELEYLHMLTTYLNQNYDPNIAIPDTSQWDAIIDPNNLVRVKAIEQTTNHDVKAVEYYLQERPEIDPSIKRWIHFGLTSQDINSSANMLQVKDAWSQAIHPTFNEIYNRLSSMAQEYASIPMLARTHGQAASPTTLGKELMVYVERLHDGFNMENITPWTTKFGGATGNFNSLALALPNINWRVFADHFILKLGLIRSQYTTQIDHYDHIAAHFDNYRRLNTILIDLCQDIWTYISMDYFKLKVVSTEVGSSAMPHKVNPIDFENAEGNLLLANNMYEFFSRKLPTSRLQRDLTDSTILRNIGVAMAHTLVALKSIIKGLDKLSVNITKIDADLSSNWNVVAEGIQILLRTHGIDDAYEIIKGMTRGADTMETTLFNIHTWVRTLNIPDTTKETIINLTPRNYTGYSIN